MRWRARTDQNQAEIVKGLLQAGCSVQSLHRVGAGVTDLLVGRAGRNYIIEVKVPGGKLNKLQVAWHQNWRGQKAVAHSLEDCMRIVGLIP